MYEENPFKRRGFARILDFFERLTGPRVVEQTGIPTDEQIRARQEAARTREPGHHEDGR